MLVKSPPEPQIAKSVAPRERRPWSRSPVFGAFQGLVCLALCLAGLETFFAAAHIGESEYLMPDKICGFTLMPDKTVTQRTEGFGSFRTNSFGMQNDPLTVAKPKGTLRVAVFGDSYVEALHVDREKNFLQTTARALSEKLHQPVQVLNFGVSNYSVAQDYLRYRSVAKQFKPDIVIQVFRVEESDKLLPQTSNYLSLVRPVFFVGPHDELVYDDTNVRAFRASSAGKKMLHNQWFRQNSRLYCLAGQMSQTLTTFGKGKGKSESKGNDGGAKHDAAPAVGAEAAPPTPATTSQAPAPALSNKERYIACYWYMMDRQLAEFARECQKDGARFMIMRTPMIKAEMDSLRVNNTESKLLFATAAKIGAPVLNLDQAFKQQYGLKNDGSHFLSGGHFNAATHAWVAAHLTDYLSDLVQKPRAIEVSK